MNCEFYLGLFWHRPNFYNLFYSSTIKDSRVVIDRLLELFFDDSVVGADGDGREEDVGDREVGRADAGDGRWRHPSGVDRHAEDQAEDQRAGTQHDPQNPEMKTDFNFQTTV